MRRLAGVLLLLIGATVQIHCAKKGFPEGGPPDVTGPTVVSTLPASGDVGVSRATAVQIEFSEPVTREKLLPNLFVSPPLTGAELQWKGNAVTITWPDSLRENVTYRVTVGANLTDRRNNPMTEPTTIAFSTGETIDEGRIVGRVYRQEAAATAVSILAYRLSETSEWDHTAPDFITTTTETGAFDLPYLPQDQFRLLAVADRNRNNKPDPGEEIGIPFFDVDLTVPVDPDPVLVFTYVYDTTTFTIKSCAVSPDGAILLAMSHPPDTATWNHDLFVVYDSLTGDKLDAQALRPLRARNSVIPIYSDAFDPGQVYRVALETVRGGGRALRSESGLPASDGECFVRWTSPVDTVGPLISLSILPTPGVALTTRHPAGLEFDKPVAAAGDTPILQVVDTTGRIIPGRIEWPDSRRIWFHPDNDWPDTTRIIISLDSTRVIDRLGNRAPAQTFHWAFTPLVSAQTGAASCRVIAPASMAPTTVCILEARATTGKLATRREAPIDSVFEWILPSGGWIVSGWLDQDGDKRWFPGALEPFRHAEPRMLLADTLYIRERFTLENVIIRF